MKIFIITLLAALIAQAADTVGESSFTVWTNSGVANIDIRETTASELLGQSSFDNWGTINLKYNNGTIKGTSDGGFTEVSCTATHCSGQVGSGTVNLDIKDNGAVLEGSVNHVYVYAKIKNGKIEIQADGSLELNQSSSGKYQGSCVLDNASISQASLKSSGTLVDRLQNDPAYFIVYLISPLVRNGL